MKTARHFFCSRAWIGLAVAGAALLPAASASAQAPSPFYSFAVDNLTSSNGDPVYAVYDSVDFNSLQISEAFADGFMQTISMPTLETQDTEVSSAQVFTFGPSGLTDPVHGTLTSAVLSGTLAFPGITPGGSGTLPLTIQPTTDPGSQYQQLVYTPFSANLLAPSPTGIAAGTFSLQNVNGSTLDSVNISITPVPAAVPEASTNISLGLLLTLGLGGMVLARRKHAGASR